MQMERSLIWLGRIGGIAGIVICAIAVLTRLMGAYWLAGFQTSTLLLAGMAGMIFACLCFLTVLTERAKAGR
jgi:hypothetical protein